MDSISEAFAAIGEDKLKQVVGNSSKIPPGKILVAVELGRDEDPNVSGERVTVVSRTWQYAGRAIAIRNDKKAIEANYVFAHISKGEPKVTACHLVKRDGDTIPTLEPLAVWPCKDKARAAGVSDEVLENMNGEAILQKWGTEWVEAGDEEDEGLERFEQRVRKAIAEADELKPFIGPKAFVIRPIEEEVDLGPDWQWLVDAMRLDGVAAVPYAPGLTGTVIVHNPGFWFGLVDDPHDTGLFFVEKNSKRRKPRKAQWSPKGKRGL